jgi:hypothetical protein
VRVFAASIVLAGAGFLAAHAAADPVPIPGVPTVTVPEAPAVPTVAVPLPAVPQLPAPAPALPEAPAVSTSSVSQTAAAVSSAAGGASSSVTPSASSTSSSNSSGYSSSTSSSSSSSSSSPSAYSSPRSASQQRAIVKHFDSSRPWIGTTGPKKRRTTILTFVLPAPAVVIFTINQLSPACRGEGKFAVKGHAGLNRVRFAGRIHGRPLGPGTYRISARTRSGRVVQRTILVIVSGSAPSPAELAAARASNVCASASRIAAGTAGTTGASSALPAGAVAAIAERSSAPQQQASATLATGANVHSGVLASAVERTARTVRPFLVALLALAIVLLSVASLPQAALPEPRMNELLARHRAEIAGLGAVAFVATVLAFLLG